MSIDQNKDKDKKVFITERINRFFLSLAELNKSARFQYRVDTKALMCRGIEDNEVQTIKRGLQAENGMFYLSRLYVPFAFFSLYRKGVFEQNFTFSELKYIIRVAIFMYMIEVAGFVIFRKMTWPIVDKYVGDNEEEYEAKKKKLMTDYLIQRDYFKNKKEPKQ